MLVLLSALVLAGCGQPLQIRPAAGKASPIPSGPAITAVPSSGGATPSQAAPPSSYPATPEASPAPASPTAAEASPAPAPASPAATLTGEQLQAIWRAEQAERVDFAPPRTYLAQQPVELRWLDPRSGQSLVVGRLIGEFPAQATFKLRSSGLPALLVVYTIDQSFGLTAISPALKTRMRAAGIADTAETYVLLSTDIAQKP
jgi:hypothetical protein